MFGGKTTELIRRLRRAQRARKTVYMFKPEIDVRFDEVQVVSHDKASFIAVPVKDAASILAWLTENHPVNIPRRGCIVGIDEAQFFNGNLVQVCLELVEQGMTVICTGLDMDFRGEPFHPMPELMARAEVTTKIHAICVVCGEEASRTQRLVNGEPAAFDDSIVLVGAEEFYEARCRKCHKINPPRNQ
ncbi:thymidine kinase [candidate division WWE3 bacterium]|uniref:Thymidine kinase n=1 Tax=candidate division WWE3 bacterium TaxID=2053526 RepID=A0A955LHM7_UNCKA|nr:thymidine kinase [candidate division WWE3 bacterium]